MIIRNSYFYLAMKVYKKVKKFNFKRHKIANTFTIIVFVLCNVSIAFSQNVKTFVTDEMENPVANVSVFNNREIIAETNDKGEFIISENFELPLNLILSHPNFYLKEINITENFQTFILSKLLQNENLNEVIISANRNLYQQKKDTLISSSVISAAKLNEYSPVDVVAAINETPGVYIQSGAINTNRITIRGVGARTPFGTNKIRAYFNGIPITNGAGETSIDHYDAENLNEIIILKGPNSSLYGSSLGGTILLSSKVAENGKTEIRTNSTFGSYNLLKNTVNIASGFKNFSLNVSYNKLQTNGFRQNSKYDREGILLTSNYRLNANNKVGLVLQYVDDFAQIPSSLGITDFNKNPTKAAFTWAQAKGFEANKNTLTGITYTHKFSEKLNNSSTIFYTYLDHYEPRPFNILDEFTNGFGARTLFNSKILAFEKNIKFDFGAEIYNDYYNWKTIENRYEDNNGNGSLEGELLSDNREKRNNLNIFGSVFIPISTKLSGQIGINFNQTMYDFEDKFLLDEIDKSAKRNFDPILAPTFSLNYKIENNSELYFNFGRGFNFPSIEETLTPEGVINGELGPEKGFNYEVGNNSTFFSEKLSIKTSFYLLNITDKLVAERVAEDQYIGRNAGKTRHLGSEFSTDYNLNITKNIKFVPYFNFEYNHHKFIDFVDDDADYSGNKLTGVPNLKMNGGLRFAIYSFQLNANFLHIGEIPLNDANILFSSAYTVFNTKIMFQKELAQNFSLQLNAGINNFTDKKYASSVLINAVGFGNSEPRYYYPGIPVNYYGGFNLKYLVN